MAIAVEIDCPGVTLEQYDEALASGGFLFGGVLPLDGIFHWVAETDDGIRVVNVWATRAAFDDFAAKAADAFRRLGVDLTSIKVEFFDVHNILFGTRRTL